MKKFIEEFKAFALRGNVMDMAIGVIIGGAFTSIVTSLTENIINPILGAAGSTDLSAFVLNIGGVELRYGAFITSIINFLIMAFVLFSGCDVVVEAFDKPDQKAMLLENLLTRLPEKPVVSGSGMAGYGSANLIKTEKRFGHVYLCGDGTSDVADGLGLMAPRVAVCSAHEGTMVLRLLIGETEP